MNPLLVTLIIVLLIFLIACMCLSLPMTKRQKQKVVSNPANYGLAYRSVFFPSADGITLSGWWIEAEGSTRTVIYMHGYTSSMDPDLKYVPAFHEAGFNVLTFDFRAHARSGGKYTTVGALEVQDVMGAYDFARQCNSWSVGLMGFSLGGRAAMLAAAKSRDFSAIVSDDGPVCLTTAITAALKQHKVPGWAASILSVMCLIGASLRFGKNLFWNEPLVLAKKISYTPVLLIHAEHDPYTRISELDKMVARSKNRIKLWCIAGAKHRESDLADPEAYINRVIGFFERYMPD